MKLRIFVPKKMKIKLSHFGLRRGLCGTCVKLTLFEDSVQNRLYLNVCAKTTIVCKGNLGRERSRPWIQIKAISITLSYIETTISSPLGFTRFSKPRINTFISQ